MSSNKLGLVVGSLAREMTDAGSRKVGRAFRLQWWRRGEGCRKHVTATVTTSSLTEEMTELKTFVGSVQVQQGSSTMSLSARHDTSGHSILHDAHLSSHHGTFSASSNNSSTLNPSSPPLNCSINFRLLPAFSFAASECASNP